MILVIIRIIYRNYLAFLKLNTNRCKLLVFEYMKLIAHYVVGLLQHIL